MTPRRERLAEERKTNSLSLCGAFQSLFLSIFRLPLFARAKEAKKEKERSRERERRFSPNRGTKETERCRTKRKKIKELSLTLSLSAAPFCLFSLCLSRLSAFTRTKRPSEIEREEMIFRFETKKQTSCFSHLFFLPPKKKLKKTGPASRASPSRGSGTTWPSSPCTLASEVRRFVLEGRWGESEKREVERRRKEEKNPEKTQNLKKKNSKKKKRRLGLLHLLRLWRLALPRNEETGLKPPLHAPSIRCPRTDQGSLESNAPLCAPPLSCGNARGTRRDGFLFSDRQGRRWDLTLSVSRCFLYELRRVGRVLGPQGAPRLEDRVQVKRYLRFCFLSWFCLPFSLSSFFSKKPRKTPTHSPSFFSSLFPLLSFLFPLFLSFLLSSRFCFRSNIIINNNNNNNETQQEAPPRAPQVQQGVHPQPLCGSGLCSSGRHRPGASVCDRVVFLAGALFHSRDAAVPDGDLD